MRVYGFDKPRSYRVKQIQVEAREGHVETPDNTLVSDERWVNFWDLMDTIKVHGYLRSAMGVVGRSSIGAWWQLRKHKEFGSGARELHRKRLVEFYNFRNRPWDNIKDFYTMAYKIMIAVMYLRYFGFAAFQIVRDGNGNPLGLDFLHGYVTPNVDDKGYFKDTAFIQYPTDNKNEEIFYDDPSDIVYIVNPDWEGFPSGGSDVQSLTDYILPLDIYLQTAAREYLQNRNTPEAFYILSPDISNDAFDDFVALIEARYAGPSNMGRNPVAVQGELDIKTVSKIPSDLPYQSTRDDARKETLAAAGVSGAKLGISDDMTNANLRELRREFHETSMVPLFKMVELAFYEQIHVREFGYDGWEFAFNNPDFLTAVEQATVNMRLHGINVWNPNEIRHRYGAESRSDPLGDLYADELQLLMATMGAEAEEPDEEQGSPPEGREDEPDAPSEVGEPTLDDQDPPRGDNHDEETRQLQGEIRRFKTFAERRLSGNKPVRPFESTIIPEEVLDILNTSFMAANKFADVAPLFDVAISEIRSV